MPFLHWLPSPFVGNIGISTPFSQKGEKSPPLDIQGDREEIEGSSKESKTRNSCSEKMRSSFSLEYQYTRPHKALYCTTIPEISSRFLHSTDFINTLRHCWSTNETKVCRKFAYSRWWSNIQAKISQKFPTTQRKTQPNLPRKSWGFNKYLSSKAFFTRQKKPTVRNTYIFWKNHTSSTQLCCLTNV